MDLALGFVFIISLMFLAMIFGERLSLFGIADGQWLTAPFDWAARFWDMLCEAADRVSGFVFDHFWWVAATVSGGVGILLIALVMVTGLSDKAEANRSDEESLMFVGSVLDHTTILTPDNVLQLKVADGPNPLATGPELVHQVPSKDRWRIPPSIRQEIVDSMPPAPPEPDVLWNPGRPEYPREPDYSRSLLNITIEPFVERRGRQVRSPLVDRMIRDSLMALRNGDWRTFSDAQARERATGSGPVLREDSQFAEDDLYARVRVIPGESVATNDLKVEKFLPEQPPAGEFEIEIRLTNLSPDTLDGLVVRELLPSAWRPVAVQPQAVYRESTITWLLNDIRPFDEKILKVKVTSSEFGQFQSYTEVSATTAVAASTGVSEPLPAVPDRREPIDRRPIEREPFEPVPFEPEPFVPEPFDRREPEPRPQERRLPPVEDLPDVQLTLLEPPQTVPVNEWIEVLFEIRNVGTAPAEGVSLRVDVPLGLSHHALNDDDLDRKIEVRIATLKPKERRKFPLKVRATTPGSHYAIAELTLQKNQLDVRPFEVIARRTTPDNSRLVPRPDF